MAFFKNFENALNSDHDLNEKVSEPEAEGDYSSAVNNRQMDLNFVEEDVEMKEENLCQSEGEPSDAGRQQSDTSGGNGRPGRRTGSSGTWGSSFWKDCQPMWGPKDEEVDLMKDEDVIAVNSDEDSDEQKDDEQSQRGQVDVPVDEMLSDDYYEQDGDEQTDSLHGRRPNFPSISGSRLPPRPAPTRKKASKSSKVARYAEEEDDDEDFEEEDDDDDDDDEEDDPDDVDFEPDFGETGKSTKNKAIMSESDDFDEDDADDEDDLDLSDEDLDYSDTRHRNSQRKSRSANRNRSSAHNRRKRRDFPDEEELSEKDSELDSDENFDHKNRKLLQLRKKSGSRSVISVDANSHSSELRTSGRSVRKVSYVESEESEEDEERANKSQKVSQDDAEEDDGDSIERVLWHQLKGMAEDAARNCNLAQPSALSTTSESEPEWDDVEFYIKWKGQSYLHCQWKPFSDLQNLTGFKKVLNYIKRIDEERKYKKALSREEAEVHDVGKEMELDLLKQYSQVERIFADRISKTDTDDVVPEYLVKWQGLSYAEATWEKDTDITFAQDAIDEYKAREEAMTVQGKMVDFQRKFKPSS